MKPNLILLLADQMRPDVLVHADTPNLSRLIRQGVHFTNAYCASPLCQPSRACIVAGKYPTQHGICGNMTPPLSQAERADTYVQHLQAAGYRTALIGKHHYYDRWSVGMDVLEDDEAIRGYGYDHVWQVVDDHIHNQDRYTRFLKKRGKLALFQEMTRTRQYDPNALAVEEFDDGYIGEQAIAYLENYDDEAPFYLQVGFLGPHPPYWVPEPYASMYTSSLGEVSDRRPVPAPKGVEDPRIIERARRARAQYFGRVSLIDHYVGKIIETLERKGQLENTLIVFTADHGDNIGDYGIFDKRYFYEQSVRVPLLMAGPGLTLNPRLGGRICRALVSGVDLYPTFLHSAGIIQEQIFRQAQDDNGIGSRDGLSLVDVANDRVCGGLRDAVFSELGTLMMVRDANWKLVYDAEQGGVQYLFNLRRDPEELDNLVGCAGYEAVEKHYVERLLSRLIRMTHTTQQKERERLQRVRV